MHAMLKPCFALFIMLCVQSLAHAGSDDQKLRLADSPATDAQTLAELARDPDWRVRAAVAANRRAPEAVLAQLATDTRQEVKIKVATNLSTPESVFRLMTRDPDLTVRSVVARFEYVPAAILGILAEDPSPAIRLEVARAFNTDRETLERLSKDEYADVSSLAAQRLAAE